MATTNRKPAASFRCGNVKATVWQNIGQQGPFYSVAFSRPFKDAAGNWKNAASFGLNDLEALSGAAYQAREWVRQAYEFGRDGSPQ